MDTDCIVHIVYFLSGIIWNINSSLTSKHLIWTAPWIVCFSLRSNITERILTKEIKTSTYRPLVWTKSTRQKVCIIICCYYRSRMNNSWFVICIQQVFFDNYIYRPVSYVLELSHVLLVSYMKNRKQWYRMWCYSI